MDIKAFFGDLGTLETVIWLLVLFIAVLWWGLQPYFRSRRRDRNGD